MGRLLPLALAAIFLLGSGGCFSDTAAKGDGLNRHSMEAMETNNGKDEADAVKNTSGHLLAVWSDYLCVLDSAYASELWAFSYVDDFLDSGDWDDLSKARTPLSGNACWRVWKPTSFLKAA